MESRRVVECGLLRLGCLLLYALGGSRIEAQGRLWEANGVTVPSNHAHALDGGGDIDGDGFPDVVVGPGTVRAISGVDGTLIHMWTSGPVGDEFGRNVAIIGDLNRDGHAEVIVGAYRSNLGGEASGAAFVYSGVDGSVLFTFMGRPFDGEGFAVCEFGDLDGDGRDDFVVSAPQADGGRGAVRVRSGRDGAVLREWSGVAGESFGYVIASVFDVDADGAPDVAISSATSEYVEVFSGGTGGLLHRFAGAIASLNFGQTIAGLGDVNGDGHADIAVGSPVETPLTFGPPRGGVRVYSGADGTELYAVASVVDARMGYSLDTIKDLDGDGVLDFATTLRDRLIFPGTAAVYVYSGRNGLPVVAIPFQSAAPLQRDPVVCNVGDVDGDGFAEFAYATAATPLRCVSLGTALGAVRQTIESWATPAGDVDGDGVRDMFEYVASGIRVLSGLDHSQIRTHSSPGFNSRATDLGDIDGDGFDDYAYGGPSDSGIELYTGRIGLRIGRLPEAADSILGLGDVDEDGRADVVSYMSGVALGESTLSLYSSGSSPVIWTRTVAANEGRLQRCGDIDRDGVEDFFLTGTRQATNEVFSGRDGSTIARHPYRTLAAFGDVDLDGGADLLVQTDGSFEQRAWIIAGDSGRRLATFNLEFPGTVLGSAGDVDGDGVLDVALIEPRVSFADHGELGTITILSGVTQERLMQIPAPSIREVFALDDNGDRVLYLALNYLGPMGNMIRTLIYVLEPSRGAIFREYGAACRGSDGNFLRASANRVPLLGHMIDIGLSAGVSGGAAALAVSGPTSGPISLSALGAVGCFAHFGATPGFVGVTLDATGRASVPWTAGFDVGAIGIRFDFQALALDPAANALGVTTSNGLALTVGG